MKKILKGIAVVILISLVTLVIATIAVGADPVPVEADQPGYVVRVLVEFGRYNDVGTG